MPLSVHAPPLTPVAPIAVMVKNLTVMRGEVTIAVAMALAVVVALAVAVAVVVVTEVGWGMTRAHLCVWLGCSCP